MFLPRPAIRSAALLAAALLRVAYSVEYPTSLADAGISVPASDGVKTVVINDFSYQPATLEIHVGDTVEWKNVDIVPHTATATNGKTFDSGRIVKGGTWRFTFTRKGTYNYFCSLHPNMIGELVVE